MKKVISFRKHWIMEYELEKGYECNLLSTYTDLRLLRVKSFEELIDGTYSRSLQKRIFNNNKEFCEIFVLVNENLDRIGTLSVMYKSGNELEYRIRECDAFIYNVYIKPEYRGRGYAKKMLELLYKYLHLEKDNFRNIRLAVSKDNRIAMKTYRSMGFYIIESKFFIRFLRKNFPYYII